MCTMHTKYTLINFPDLYFNTDIREKGRAALTVGSLSKYSTNDDFSLLDHIPYMRI
jgi:hypothetical protein